MITCGCLFKQKSLKSFFVHKSTKKSVLSIDLFYKDGYLQNFIADDDESEAESTGSDGTTEADDSDASVDSDAPLSKKKKKAGPGARKQHTTRNAVEKSGAKNSLVGGLDEAKREELAEDKGWWCQFLDQGPDAANGAAAAAGGSKSNGGEAKTPTDDQLLQRIELGSKMILLMEILKECEMLGDKVLVFSQSLLSLDLIEEFLRVSHHTSPLL